MQKSESFFYQSPYHGIGAKISSNFENIYSDNNEQINNIICDSIVNGSEYSRQYPNQFHEINEYSFEKEYEMSNEKKEYKSEEEKEILFECGEENYWLLTFSPV